jgi:hypothetical protein
MSEEAKEESYIDEVNEELSLALSDITFDGSSLEAWLDELTITIPPLPCTSFEITNTIIDLNNKYQNAYNCLSKLLVLTNRAEKKFKSERDKAVSKKLKEYSDKSVTKTPTIEKLEILVVNADAKLKELQELYRLYETITEFFSNQKNKLEKIFSLVEKVSYYASNSDKLIGKAKYNEGL